jgi:hypothetical protein
VTAQRPVVDAPPDIKRIVAIQPATKLGDVEGNLTRIEDLVNNACREHSPDMVFLPESMTTPNLYHRAMRHVARPIDGTPYQLLTRLARTHGCMVGGGYIAKRGHDTKGTYCLAEPDGTAHFHDKDQPSFWENNYYSAGTDDGLVHTSAGPIGLANGFEWGRTRTNRRLEGKIRLLAGGMFFASYPTWKLTAPYLRKRDQELLLQYARETPGRMARMLGVGTVHPSHVGDYTMATMLVPGLKWSAQMHHPWPLGLRRRRGLHRGRRHPGRPRTARPRPQHLLELLLPQLRPHGLVPRQHPWRGQVPPDEAAPTPRMAAVARHRPSQPGRALARVGFLAAA